MKKAALILNLLCWIFNITYSQENQSEKKEESSIQLSEHMIFHNYDLEDILKETNLDAIMEDQHVPIRGTEKDSLGTSPLTESITYIQNLQLPYTQNNFTLEFAAIDYAQPELNQYKYLLKGFSRDTFYTTAERPFATFTNISPGNYTFQVWGSNNDGIWSQKSRDLNIRITSPWYWAPWSKLLYVLLALSLLILLFIFQIRRQLAIRETQRLKELDQMKTHLYTNITHEFRTPLTVISGMVDHISTQPDKWLEKGLAMIKRNAHSLLHLVNQMLDLAKLESNHLPLNVIEDDLISYLQYVTSSFHSLAESQDISFHFLSSEEACNMDFDPEKIQQIMSNLLSNAIKFTPEGGDVYIIVNKVSQASVCEIQIQDTGVGISSDQLPFIFDRFYQADSSSTRAGEGKSTSHVIRAIRLEKAKQLLLTTDKQISEIGYEVGFSSRSYFTQIFTKEFGLSPREFREDPLT